MFNFMFQVVAETASVLRSRQQVVAMLFTVVIFFFACMMPFKGLTLWFVASGFMNYDPMKHMSNETYYNLLYFARIMFYTNSAINPILYNIMSSKFREGFKRIFQKITCKNSLRHDNNRSSGEYFESSALKLHARQSVTKDTSFEVLSDGINENDGEIVLPVEDPAKEFYTKGGKDKGYGRKNKKQSDNATGDDSVKAESILLIEEKQYRLIKAKGHFNI